MDNFKREEKVQKAVYHLLTTDVTLPWWPIINISKQSLVKKGYLIAVEEKKFIGHVTNYEFEPEKVREVELHLNEIQNVLNEFSSDTQYSMVLNAVKKGISARVEHQSNDD